MEEQHPTIKISKEFKEWLEKQGAKGESFEEVIKRLMPSYMQTHKREVKLLEKKKGRGIRREMRSVWVEK